MPPKKFPDAKIPPQNVEAERAVLGSILIDKNAVFRVVDTLSSSDFYLPSHEKIYETILELLQRSQPIDILTLTNRLKENSALQEVGGPGYLAELTNNVTTASNVAHFASLVKEKKVLRDLIRASAEIAEGAFEPKRELEELLDDIEQKIFSISQKSLPKNFVPVADGLKTAYERFERLHEQKGTLRGITTGFPGIDNILSGFQKSDLIVIGARPSLGKTTLALDIARNAALFGNVPVGIFSLEMAQEQVIDRLVAAQSQVPLWKLRTGRITEDVEFQMIQHGLDELSKVSIFIDDTPSPNILQMRAMARRLQVEHGLGLLIVDYLQLIAPRRTTDNMVSQVTEITRGLKGLARELDVPILALSQLSRAVDQRDNKKPQLHDLRESGCLTGDSLIMRADTGELVSIETLARRIKQTPVPVYSLDENYQLTIRPLVKAFASGTRKTFELLLQSGRRLKASGNHLFRTLGGWKPLEALRVGEALATPRFLNPLLPANTLKNAELVLLAHLLGDGCVLPRQPVHYTTADTRNMEAVIDAAQELFGITARIVKQENWWHVYLPSPYRLARGRHHPIMKWFETLDISPVRSYKKVIPSTVFSQSEERVALFLRHLWATDGNISQKLLRGRKPSAAIYYATASPRMARQVQHLLLRLEINSTLRASKKANYRPTHQIHISGSENQLRFLRTVGCFGKRGDIIPLLQESLADIDPNPNNDIIPSGIWRSVVEEARAAAGASWREVAKGLAMSYCGSALFKSGTSRGRTERLATFLKSPQLHNLAHSDVYWDRIVSIQPAGEEEIFDATVEGTHNFIANDIVAHNSIEQDADVVMFIYRKDRDRQDIPPEEQNVAEILVAKHRNGPLGSVKLRFDQDRVTFRTIDERHEEAPEAF